MANSDDIRVVPADATQWANVDLLLGGDGDRGCWCQAWRGKDDIAKATGESRPQTLRRQMASSSPPGFLAMLGEDAVGWVGVSVRVRYRRKGIARALLHGVVDAARRAGAPGIEAYPIDPEGRRVSGSLALVGIASTFDAAGFRRVLVTDAKSARLPRILMRVDFPRQG